MESFFIEMRRRVKMRMPVAMMARVMRSVVVDKKVNSKKSRANGMRKAAAIMTMMLMSRAERSLLSGLEIQ